MRETLTDEDWLEAHIARANRLPSARQDLPALPPDDIQASTTGHAGAPTLREAFAFYQECLRAFRQYGEPWGTGSRLLDFGVGWGRVVRFFLRELEVDNIYGIDVDPGLIGLCQSTFSSGTFETCAPFPPSRFPDQYFQTIVGYSVFSHLSEDACHQWMREFHRIIRPGGMLALTTRSRAFFDYCEALVGTSSYTIALSHMFDSFADARARYDAGEFVHSSKEGVSGGDARAGNFYGETFIPKAYAATAWADYFRLVEFSVDPTGRVQPVMFFQRTR